MFPLQLTRSWPIFLLGRSCGWRDKWEGCKYQMVANNCRMCPALHFQMLQHRWEVGANNQLYQATALIALQYIGSQSFCYLLNGPRIQRWWFHKFQIRLKEVSCMLLVQDHAFSKCAKYLHTVNLRKSNNWHTTKTLVKFCPYIFFKINSNKLYER